LDAGCSAYVSISGQLWASFHRTWGRSSDSIVYICTFAFSGTLACSFLEKVSPRATVEKNLMILVGEARAENTDNPI
jgi:hypothetical protein